MAQERRGAAVLAGQRDWPELRHRLSLLLLIPLIPLLPVFLGGRTPFIPGYLADVILVAAMAVVLVLQFWDGFSRRLVPWERWLWLAVAVGFSAYLLLQILALPILARVLGPYPEALWASDQPPVRWTPNPGMTLLGWAVFLALWTAAYAVRVMHSRDLGWLCLAVAASALFQAFYGLLAHAGGSTAVLGIWERVSPDAVTGTFTNRNLYSAYMTLTGPMAILVWWLRDIPGIGRLPRASRAAAMALAVALVVIAMMATGSRQGAIAGVVALLVAGYFWLYRDIEPGAKRRWATASVAALVVLVLLWYGPAMILERFTEIGLDSNRWEIWQLVRAEVPAALWIAGSGLGSFEAVFRTVQTAELTSRYSHAHNDLLQWWLETGVVGLVLLALVAGGLLRRATITRLRAPVYGGLAAMAVVALVDFSWHMTGTQLVIACYIGLLLRPVRR